MFPAGEFQPVSVAQGGRGLGVAVGLGPPQSLLLLTFLSSRWWHVWFCKSHGGLDPPHCPQILISSIWGSARAWGAPQALQ